jgi:hypothetical protein
MVTKAQSDAEEDPLTCGAHRMETFLYAASAMLLSDAWLVQMSLEADSERLETARARYRLMRAPAA